MADSLLNEFLASGTTAARMAFTPAPPTPASGPDPGYLWWDTDLQAEYAYDFGTAAWVATGGGGAGTVTNTGTLTAGKTIIGNGSADVTVSSLTAQFVGSSSGTAAAASMSTAKMLGRATAGSGAVEEIAVTGSGSAVLATSPTLVTPALGTPSAAVLTNATGLPATTGLVGVPAICEGRLTTESGVPVSTTDRTSQGTIYWKPCTPDGRAKTNGMIALYNGSAVILKSITQISLALAITSGKNKNVYVDYNAGTPQLVLGADWTNDTTESETLADQNGILVLSGTPAYRYVGVIRASGSNVTEDSGGITGTTQVGGKRFVWNAFNQVPRQMKVIDTTDSWAYATATIRQANGASGNKVEWVTGNVASLLDARVVGAWGGNQNTSMAKIGIGIDSTTTFSGIVGIGDSAGNATTIMPIPSFYQGQPGLGYHYASWNEMGATGAVFSQFYGDESGNGGQSGLTATIWG